MANEGNFYLSSEWKSLRDAVLARDNYTCQSCGYTKPHFLLGFGMKRNGRTLIAHHLQERKAGGADELSNLTTLCAPCHNSLPKSQETKEKIRQAKRGGRKG